jgi:hypothetical protein
MSGFGCCELAATSAECGYGTDTKSTVKICKRNKVLGTCMSTEDFLAAPQGFEPRYADPESAVLPLNEGALLSLSGSFVIPSKP